MDFLIFFAILLLNQLLYALRDHKIAFAICLCTLLLLMQVNHLVFQV